MTAPDNNDLQSISVTSAFNNIVSFFNSQDNNSSWKSLTASSEGSFLIRLLATVTSNISYKIVSYFREAFLSTCNILSSAIGISVNLGYSAYRGSNQERLVTITPGRDITTPKFTVVGTYNQDYDIIIAQNYQLSANEPIDINTVIGKIKTVSQTAGTTSLKIFSFYTDKISENIVLFRDGLEVPFSKIPRDMANDMYWVRTNPFSSVDIQYLNNATGAQYIYSSGTEFSIQYIELADVPTIPFTTSMLILPGEVIPFCTLDNTRIIKQFIPPENVSSIKTTAPYYHETQNLIRAKKDYPKRLPEIDTAILTSDYSVVVPTYAAVTYIKNDYSLLTDEKLVNIYNVLNNERFLGTPLPDMTTPNRELISLKIEFKFTSTFVNQADVRTDIDNLLQTYYYRRLNNSFSTYDLEELFTKSLSYVRYSRVSLVDVLRANSTYYTNGNIINVGSTYYKATSTLGISGSTEPDWKSPLNITKEIDVSLATDSITQQISTSYSDSITTDNNLVWKTYKRLNLEPTEISEWSANTNYKIGDHVYSKNGTYYMYKVVDLIKYCDTALSSPPASFDLGAINAFIEDGDIIWVGKLLNTSDPVRTGNTNYRLGNSVQVGDYSYECVGYRGVSNTLLPIFELSSYPIVSQGTEDSYGDTGNLIPVSYFDIPGNYTNYFKVNDTLKVYTSNESFYSFSVKDVHYVNSSATTRIDVKQTLVPGFVYTSINKRNIGTFDGNIFWEIQNDLTVYNSSWKTYNTISYSLISIK